MLILIAMILPTRMLYAAADVVTLQELTTASFNVVFPGAVLLGMFLIIKAGYTLMTSQGDPQKTMEGKENLTSAIMGMIFVLGSVGILRMIIRTFITG